MEVIASLDLLNDHVVRLTRGEFSTAVQYGEPEQVLERLAIPDGSRLHVVDLEGARSGRPLATDIVRRLSQRDLIVQVGGGIRSLEDACRWFDCGVQRIVVGTVAAESFSLLRSLVEKFGADRILPAVDIFKGAVRVAGWTRTTATPLAGVFAEIESLGIGEVMVTDISRDGALQGPSFELYRSLRSLTSLRLIASGGVTTVNDVIALSRFRNISGCVIGKALLDGTLHLRSLPARIRSADTMPVRIVPCLDVRDGRVVKGVQFENIRDAGDPVSCAMRYEAEGADEIVMLDIAATEEGRAAALDTVRRVADSLFIPLTVGGGVRSVSDFRALLQAGADRVAINSAALERPNLVGECASEFGVQAVVLSCDAKRVGGRWLATTHGGRVVTSVDAVEWCSQAASAGAGEILLTSVDRDGTGNGFDLPLLRAVTARIPVNVIASGGGGALTHFRDAVETGGAQALLAASLFHDRQMSIADVKAALAAERIPVR